MSVPLAPMQPGGPFSFGKPEPLFSLAAYFRGTGRTFDVSSDGRRFLAIRQAPTATQAETVVVVSHWFEELKARMPIKQ